MNGKKIQQSTLCLLLTSLWLALPAAADDKGKGKGDEKKHGAPAATATPAATRSAVTTQAAPAAATRAAPAATAAPTAAAPAAAAPKGPETALGRVAALVAARKAVLTRRAIALAGASEHLREADKAQKRHAAVVKAKNPGKETPAYVISVANTEAAAASAQAIEAEKAGAEADAIDSQLADLVKAAETRLANAKAAAQAAKAAATAARKAEQDAKKAELTAKLELVKISARAGLGTATALEARRKKASDEIAKLKAKVQASGAATVELGKPAPAAAAPAAAAPGKPATAPGKPATTPAAPH